MRASDFNSPVVANGIVYFATSDGYLYAYSLHGQAVSAQLSVGELGVRPALSSLRPNRPLKAR